MLSKTSPHDKILEEYRKQHIELEAVGTALPSESDGYDEDTVTLSLYIIYKFCQRLMLIF